MKNLMKFLTILFVTILLSYTQTAAQNYNQVETFIVNEYKGVKDTTINVFDTKFSISLNQNAVTLVEDGNETIHTILEVMLLEDDVTLILVRSGKAIEIHRDFVYICWSYEQLSIRNKYYNK